MTARFLTAHKRRIAKTLSYSIGSEALSAALADVPQSALISLHFGPATYASKGRPPKSNHYSVLQVRYLFRKPTQFSAKNMVARGDYEPRWEILIHEVPREQRHTVQKLLDTEGLSRVRQWLNARSHLTGREGWHNFAIMFDEAQQSLSFEEEVR